MPISFLKSTANNNGYVVRPSGYTFPAGLNIAQAAVSVTLIDYLVVAGGGAGGGTSPFARGGGGGAGGFLTSSGVSINPGTAYTVTVGAGGPAASGRGVNGSDSIISGTGFATVTATGGGGGGASAPAQGGGASGGSGGGGCGDNTYGVQTGGPGTPGQGYAGGAGIDAAPKYPGGGGGGAGAIGTPAVSGSTVTNGGVGLSSSYSGTPAFYAGGGGGWSNTSPAASGGNGGGGAGGLAAPAGGTAGTPNTGGGGGGGNTGTAGGAGGSGIVIVRYTGSQAATGGTVNPSSTPGYTIHTFTGPGSFNTNTTIAATYSVN